jgi:hypothetical protein
VEETADEDKVTAGVDELAAGILELAAGTTIEEETEEAITDEETEEAATDEEAEATMELDETAAVQSRGENNSKGLPCLGAVTPISATVLSVKKQVPA